MIWEKLDLESNKLTLFKHLVQEDEQASNNFPHFLYQEVSHSFSRLVKVYTCWSHLSYLYVWTQNMTITILLADLTCVQSSLHPYAFFSEQNSPSRTSALWCKFVGEWRKNKEEVVYLLKLQISKNTRVRKLDGWKWSFLKQGIKPLIESWTGSKILQDIIFSSSHPSRKSIRDSISLHPS